MPRILIIGAGPAGLSAAVHALRASPAAQVALVDHAPRCGTKLLATGGGHCNATNLRPAREWPPLFGKQGRFITPAMNFLPREKLEEWFKNHGDPLETTDNFHLFPKSRSAKNVRDALQSEAESLGAQILLNTRCAQILTDAGTNTVTAALLESGGTTKETPADAIILATGGASWPSTGSDWSGCRMAEALGHTVAPPAQGLVGLRTNAVSHALSGLILPRARVAFKAKGRKEESRTAELLLTHTGISGPAVLDVSATVCAVIAKEQTPQTIRIRWNAEMDEKAWRGYFATTRAAAGRTTIATLLRERDIPQRLAAWLCEKAETPPATPAAALKAAARDTLTELLGNFPATVTSGEGWDKAMITRGGVDVREVDPETLESRLIKNLHFAGEMLNVDAPCGGYNLHWAFASGALAGAEAVSLY